MNHSDTERIFGWIRHALGVKLYPWQKKAIEAILASDSAPHTQTMPVVVHSEKCPSLGCTLHADHAGGHFPIQSRGGRHRGINS